MLTQFVVSEKNNEKLAVIKSQGNKPTTLAETQTLDQAIKLFMLCNAAGIIGTDVFVVADPSMDEQDCIVHEVFGLSHSTMVGGTGYLCVCKTSNGNSNFFPLVFPKRCHTLCEDQ